MNSTSYGSEHPSAPEPPSGAPHPPTPPPPSARFFWWLRSLGISRGQNRWIGGVASGLAAKWGIDPVIVRGLAVVLSLFFGVGVLAYGIAWALLPEPDGRIHAEEVARGHWSGGMTGAAILTLIGLAGPGRGVVFGRQDWFPWPLLGVAAIVALIIWAVNRNTGRTAGPGASGFAADAWPHAGRPYAPEPASGSFGEATSGAGGFPREGMGGGPFGHTVPLPPLPPLPRRIAVPRLGTAASLLALGLALVAGGLVLLLDSQGVLDLGGYAAATAVAVAGAVLGVAIILGGILGRASGGLSAFAVLALVTAAILTAVPQGGSWTLLSRHSWSPVTPGTAQDGYAVTMGEATIDLTEVYRAPLANDVTVPVNVTAGDATIRVPDNVPITVQSKLTAADFTVDGGRIRSGFGADRFQVNESAAGHGITLDLSAVAASVNIERVPVPSSITTP